MAKSSDERLSSYKAARVVQLVADVFNTFLSTPSCSADSDCNDEHVPYCSTIFGRSICLPIQTCSSDNDCSENDTPHCTDIFGQGVCSPFMGCGSDNDCTDDDKPNCDANVFGQRFCSA